MKKIIAMAVAAICLVSASFALDLEFGARAFLGRDLDLDTDLRTNYATAKDDKTFDFGFGGYGNFALFGGLGIQAEVNYVKSSTVFQAEGKQDIPYEMHVMDLSPMVWLNLDLWKLTIGFGAGPNFSILVGSAGDVVRASKQDFDMGLIAGADFKFYFTDHLGLVLSGRYVMDFEREEIDVYGVNTGVSKYDPSRKTVYGGLGIEWKLF
jgi:hypothetical protein